MGEPSALPVRVERSAARERAAVVVLLELELDGEGGAGARVGWLHRDHHGGAGDELAVGVEVDGPGADEGAGAVVAGVLRALQAQVVPPAALMDERTRLRSMLMGVPRES